MRVLITGLTVLFLLVGIFGLAGGIAGIFTTGATTFPEVVASTHWNSPDPLSLCLSALQIAFSLLLMTTAAYFAKMCWPQARDAREWPFPRV